MSLRTRLRAAGALLGRILRKSHQDELGLRTSALAFSTLIALVPLLAGISILVARTLRADDRRLLELAIALLPYPEESIVAALESFLDHAESVSGFAILGFILTSVLTFFGVQQTLFRIFRVEQAPSLARRLVTFSLLFFWGPFLVGFAQAGYLLLGQTRPELARRLEASPLFGLLPFVFTVLGFAMLYWRASVRRIRFRDAAAGALFTTIGLELLTELFQVYVAQFTFVQRAVYGTFAILLFFVLSVQLAWWILLLGAELASVLADQWRGAPAPAELEPDPWIGLGALELLAAPGRPSVPVHELAARVGLDPPGAIVHLRPLVDAGMLESGAGYRLALAPQQVRIAAVLAAYRRKLAGDTSGPLPERTARLRLRLRHSLEHDVGDETLTDLLAQAKPDVSASGALDRPDAPG